MNGDFRKGEVLTAAALNELAARVARLQGRRAGFCGGTRRRALRMPARRAAGFELVEEAGVVLVRQGFVDVGHGRLLQVGDEEWNVVGALEPMTIWLEIGRSAADCRVVAGEYDETTPEKNLRRRLGYVREVADGGGLRCVQVLSGLVTAAAPRRCMGENAGLTDEPGVMVRCDCSDRRFLAGMLVGRFGDVVPDDIKARVSFGWTMGTYAFDDNFTWGLAGAGAGEDGPVLPARGGALRQAMHF